MGNYILLASIGIFGFLLLFMFFKLGENKENNHYILQLVVLGFLLGLFVLIGKTALDEKNYCAWNVVNSTTTNGVNLYNYNYMCEENTHTTTRSFYNTIIWFVKVVMMYIFLYITIEFFNYAKALIKKRGN